MTIGVEETSSSSRSWKRRISRLPAQAPAKWLKMLTTLSETLRFTYAQIGELALGINYFIQRQVSHSSVAAQKDPPTFWSAGAIFFIADASTACAIGSRRAWSRAMLRKIQSRSTCVKVRRRTRFRMKKKKLDEKKVGNLEAMELRKLVPGGEAMEICKLLDETAHYIKCLTTQVKVMRRIEDFYSPN